MARGDLDDAMRGEDCDWGEKGTCSGEVEDIK